MPYRVSVIMIVESQLLHRSTMAANKYLPITVTVACKHRFG